MSGWAWWLILGLLLGWLIEWAIDWFYWRRRHQAILVQLDAANDRVTTMRATMDRSRTEAAQFEEELAALRESLVTARAGGERLRTEYDTLNQRLQREQVVSDELRSTMKTLQTENDQLRNEINVARNVLHTFQETATGARIHLTGQMDAPQQHADDHATARLRPEQLASKPMPPPQTEMRRDPLIDINGIGPVYERRLFDAGILTFRALASLSPEQIREIIKAERWQEVHPDEWIEEARLLAERRRSQSS